MKDDPATNQTTTACAYYDYMSTCCRGGPQRSFCRTIRLRPMRRMQMQRLFWQLIDRRLSRKRGYV